MFDDGTGFGSVQNNDGSGRSKNIKVLRNRIHNTDRCERLNSNSDICVRWVGEEPRPCLDGELCEECAHHEFPRLDVRLYVDCGGKPAKNVTTITDLTKCKNIHHCHVRFRGFTFTHLCCRGVLIKTLNADPDLGQCRKTADTKKGCRFERT